MKRVTKLLAALLALILGFFIYGKIVDTLFGPTDKPTPAVVHNDGVDYIPLPTWKVFMIQLLNIAGLGPIFGALGGAMWGPSVYLWIVFGTIFAGGVHDYISGMISLREDGKSISEVVGHHMGGTMLMIMRVFAVVLLVLVVTVFATGPAGLLSKLTGVAVTYVLPCVFLYYFLATLLPVDKIIARFYPLFGACLIIMALGICLEMAADLQKSAAKKKNPYCFVDTGLYRIVRCPNYLGELILWAGVLVSGIGSLHGTLQWAVSVLGFILIVYIMFSGTRRLEIRQDRNYALDSEYLKYIKTVPILLPFVPLYSVKKYTFLVA
jgi:carbon starvation protein CstA